MSFFPRLTVYYDEVFRSAAMNMAIDEALLAAAVEPAIRFYRWNAPALSFGYFGRFADVAPQHTERDLVRRWTGGGIVFHDDDLTYALVVPSADRVNAESSLRIYREVHRALRDALRDDGHAAELVESSGDKISDRCFANPVRADVVLDGEKIAGAAQRRTRRGLLQQGSIQNVAISAALGARFATKLGGETTEAELCPALLDRAAEIALQKYGTVNWLQRR